MIIDLIEYEPSTRADRIAKKAGQEYCGIGEQGREGFTCLSIRASGASRRHHIEVGQVHAITIGGRRYELQSDWQRWRTRAQEIRFIIEGECEDWAREFFDHSDATTAAVSEGGKEREGAEIINGLLGLAAIALLIWLFL